MDTSQSIPRRTKRKWAVGIAFVLATAAVFFFLSFRSDDKRIQKQVEILHEARGLCLEPLEPEQMQICTCKKFGLINGAVDAIEKIVAAHPSLENFGVRVQVGDPEKIVFYDLDGVRAQRQEIEFCGDRGEVIPTPTPIPGL